VSCAVWHKIADNLDWWGEEFDFREERAAAAAALALDDLQQE
jgi:hypothetical protein